jgi:hypothetical protein
VAAMRLVNIFAYTIAATSSQFTVGRVYRDGSEIVAPLMTNGRAWRFLRVPFSTKNGFGRTQMINPVTGEVD